MRNGTGPAQFNKSKIRYGLQATGAANVKTSVSPKEVLNALKLLERKGIILTLNGISMKKYDPVRLKAGLKALEIGSGDPVPSLDNCQIIAQAFDGARQNKGQKVSIALSDVFATGRVEVAAEMKKSKGGQTVLLERPDEFSFTVEKAKTMILEAKKKAI